MHQTFKLFVFKLNVDVALSLLGHKTYISTAVELTAQDPHLCCAMKLCSVTEFACISLMLSPSFISAYSSEFLFSSSTGAVMSLTPQEVSSSLQVSHV